MGAPEGADIGHISIHALLAESDFKLFSKWFCDTLISIHALLAESDGKTLSMIQYAYISIHALLAESDAFLPSSL